MSLINETDDNIELNLSQYKKKKKIIISEQKEEEPDYAYSDLLRRIYNKIEVKAETKKAIVPIPRCGIVGRNTVWLNFGITCKALHRNIEHVRRFVEKELVVKANILQDQSLSMRFKLKKGQLDTLIIAYSKEYIQCHACLCTETILSKDSVTRLTFVVCNICKSKRSVV